MAKLKSRADFQVVDFYRPKFVILENVRTFADYRKGKVLKLTMRTFSKMGFQCTFAILQVRQPRLQFEMPDSPAVIKSGFLLRLYWGHEGDIY